MCKRHTYTHTIYKNENKIRKYSQCNSTGHSPCYWLMCLPHCIFLISRMHFPYLWKTVGSKSDCCCAGSSLGCPVFSQPLDCIAFSSMDLIEGDFVHQVLSDGDLFLSLAHVYRQAVPHRIVKVQSMLPVGPNSAFFRRHHWRAGHNCMRPAPSNPTAIQRCLPQQCQWPCRNLDAQQTGVVRLSHGLPRK